MRKTLRMPYFVLMTFVLTLWFAVPTTSALEICGLSTTACPQGFHVAAFTCNTSCPQPCYSYTGYHNATRCEPDTVPQFSMCFRCNGSCPTGYDTQWGSSTSCQGPTDICAGPLPPGNQLTCTVKAPTLTVSLGEGPTCGDLGKAHDASTTPPYLAKNVVTARPGAQVVQYNRHVSCPGSSWYVSGQTRTVPASGTLEAVIGNAADYNCNNGNLGRWEMFVVADGKSSPVRAFNAYNHNCPLTLTCSDASNFCPN